MTYTPKIRSNSSNSRKVVYFIPAILWLSMIVIASLISAYMLPKVKIQAIPLDKVAHFLMYFGLSVCILWGIKKITLPKINNIVIVFIFGLFIGILMEFLQREISIGRNYEISDIIANIVGSFFGCLLFITRSIKII